MAATKKFMFETVFEDLASLAVNAAPSPEDVEEQEIEPEEIIPTFSQEDLEAARKEGFQAGKEEGLNATLDSIERQVSATLGNMENEIARLIDGQKKSNEEITHLALSVAVSIARKMLPEMASRNALDEIEAVIKIILPRLINEPRVTIRIHGDVEADVNGRLKTLVAGAGFDGQIVVNPDNGMEIGDCHLEWSCGGADRNTRALWREIDEIIARNFHNELLTLSEEVDVEDTAQDEIATESLDPVEIADPSADPDLTPNTDD